MRLGDFVKFLPAPVLAGFQNAAAVLIFTSQINSMLGYPRSCLSLKSDRT